MIFMMDGYGRTLSLTLADTTWGGAATTAGTSGSTGFTGSSTGFCFRATMDGVLRRQVVG